MGLGFRLNPGLLVPHNHADQQQHNDALPADSAMEFVTTTTTNDDNDSNIINNSEQVSSASALRGNAGQPLDTSEKVMMFLRHATHILQNLRMCGHRKGRWELHCKESHDKRSITPPPCRKAFSQKAFLTLDIQCKHDLE